MKQNNHEVAAILSLLFMLFGWFAAAAIFEPLAMVLGAVAMTSTDKIWKTLGIVGLTSGAVFTMIVIFGALAG